MKKLTKLKICNWSLLPLTAAILASGIWLEVTACSGIFAVGLHIALGLLFTVMIAVHLFLHFGRSNWFVRFSKFKKPAIRILWWTALATLITGLAASVRWFISPVHTPLGGIHGKIGFLMILLTIAHTARRLPFFKK